MRLYHWYMLVYFFWPVILSQDEELSKFFIFSPLNFHINNPNLFLYSITIKSIKSDAFRARCFICLDAEITQFFLLLYFQELYLAGDPISWTLLYRHCISCKDSHEPGVILCFAFPDSLWVWWWAFSSNRLITFLRGLLLLTVCICWYILYVLLYMPCCICHIP